MLDNDARLELRNALRGVSPIDAINFLAEWLSERVTHMSAPESIALMLAHDFKEELVSQVNERI